MNDLRYALRSLGKHPGFTLVAVLTLALGIGANTAMFSVVNAVLLRPLPFPGSGELVQVFSTWRGNPSTVSPPDFTDWRNDNQVFSELAAMNAGSDALTGDGPAEQVPAAAVTGGFFTVLGHGLWQRRFGADPAVVGRRITVDAEPYTVVGVMPAGSRPSCGRPWCSPSASSPPNVAPTTWT